MEIKPGLIFKHTNHHCFAAATKSKPPYQDGSLLITTSNQYKTKQEHANPTQR